VRTPGCAYASAVNYWQRRCRSRSLLPVFVALTKRAPDNLTLLFGFHPAVAGAKANVTLIPSRGASSTGTSSAPGRLRMRRRNTRA
jgi:hypothetical protein